MRNIRFVFAIATLALFAGCTSTETVQIQPQPARQIENLIIGEPERADIMNQRALGRISQVLAHVEEMTSEQRAELLYQRGRIYDGFGLRDLAFIDFQYALRYKPDLVEAYNFIGIHHTQNRDFVDAYQAFDSALEIDPAHAYAIQNRGIALYYGGRPELAADDLVKFWQQQPDVSYRTIWVYIAEREVDPEQALVNLRERRSKVSGDDWAGSIIDFYLGDINQTQLMDEVTSGVASQNQLTRRLCEVYFYLGKYYGAMGQDGIASSYFRLALSTNVFDYVEHRYATLELNLIQEERS